MIEVCAVEELKALRRKVVKVDNIEILLLFANEEFYAVNNFCPHAQTRLESGIIEDGTLTCSNHGACFDLKSGAVRIDKIDEDFLEYIDVDNLPFGPMKTYPLKIENDKIYIEI